MSNQQVGTVFDRVIQEVCDGSQVDFEESGVDQQTLLDLRKSWQKKLSSLGVAHFPWDPPPPQPAPPQTQNILPPTATVPSNAPRPGPPPQPQHHVPPPPLQQPIPQSAPATAPPLQAPTPVGAGPNAMGQQQPHIKTEPGVNGQPGMIPMNNMMMPNSSNPQSAQERAANMLRQRYGAAAANSVSQLQAQSQAQAAMAMPGQQRPQPMQHVPNGQAPQIKQEPGYPPVSQPPVGNTQTDGAGDDALSAWKAEVARRREAAERQGGEGDRLLREHLRQRMLQLEGGGLMLPLDEHDYSSKTLTRGLVATQAEPAEVSEVAGSSLHPPKVLGAQFDGQVMLCTYDKVQRVKNKWKCTLKDGILTTGGKEYVFHKGQGEFEW
ncbi:short chain dehydrogenase family protein [Aspergillus niger]|uniref:Transcription initiation factor IIA large subunit n=1 Tax=Aspergillus niger TaxID=5061 RepID=A0A505IJB9_ASPNG|nr:short chain dehydrogenase family protein [Aspergillus niger]